MIYRETVVLPRSPSRRYNTEKKIQISNPDQVSGISKTAAMASTVPAVEDEKAVALLMSLGLKEQYAREQARNKKTVKIFTDVLKEVWCG